MIEAAEGFFSGFCLLGAKDIREAMIFPPMLFQCWTCFDMVKRLESVFYLSFVRAL